MGMVEIGTARLLFQYYQLFFFSRIGTFDGFGFPVLSRILSLILKAVFKFEPAIILIDV
jgi:hypothetical protein